MSYMIAVEPSTRVKLTATSSDGHRCITTTALLNGARYWQAQGAPSSAIIVTIWSSGSSHWALRSTIGYASKLTVKGDRFRRPNKAAPQPHP
jgi:hypothetical protein